MTGFVEAFAFLTPLGGARPPTSSARRWFPVVGALQGAALGMLWWGALHWWTPAVVAVLLVAADLGLTGMLHFDGLADAADGLLPHLSRERRLEVMAEAQTGAFGVTVTALVVVTRVIAVASLEPLSWHASIVLFAALWAVSRSLMSLVIASVAPARPGGLSNVFAGSTGRVSAAGAVVVAVLMAQWALPVGGPAAVFVALAAGIGVVRLACTRLGGYTGDVLGAAGVMAETVGLLVAAARW